MKVRVTVENLETGEKNSRTGDGAMMYVNDGGGNHIISLGDLDAVTATLSIAYAAVVNTSERHPNGAAGVYDDIINALKNDAMTTILARKDVPEMTMQEIEKRLVDAIRGAFKDEA